MNNIRFMVLISYIIENEELFLNNNKEKTCKSLKNIFIEKESAFEIFNDIIYLKNSKHEMILFTHNTFILSIKPEDIKKDNISIHFIDPFQYEIGKIIKIGEEKLDTEFTIKDFFVFILNAKSKYFNYKKEVIEIIQNCQNKNLENLKEDKIELKIEELLDIINRCYKKN